MTTKRKRTECATVKAGAVSAREEQLLRTGIEAGYFLALDHVERALEKRLANMDAVGVKWNRVGNFREVERIAHRRELVLSVLDMVDMHRERIKKAFDLEGVKVL